MKRVRAVVDADLGRTPRTVNMLLLVEDDEDTLTEEAGADIFEATGGQDRAAQPSSNSSPAIIMTAFDKSRSGRAGNSP